MKTRITFANHEMQLKVRQNSDQAWKLEEQYVPDPAHVESLAQGNRAEGGHAPVIIDEDMIEKARKTVRIGNFPKNEIGNLIEIIKPAIGSPIAKKIGTVSFKNGAASFVCEDANMAKNVCKLGKEKLPTYGGKRLFFDSYTE